MRGAKLLGILLGLSIFALFIYLLVLEIPRIRENVTLRYDMLLALVGLGLLVFVLRACMNRVVFSPLGVKVSLLNWIGIVMAGTLANTLPFLAGAIAKGYYLKRIHNLPYRIFAGGQIALFALVICANGFVGLLLLATCFRDQTPAVVWGLFALMACAGFVLLLPDPIQRLVGKERFPWPVWTVRQRTIAWLGGGLSQFVILLVLAVRLKLCFAMGLEPVDFAACLLFSASIAITRIAALTPASIGIRELMIGMIAHLIGFEFGDALIASTIDRIVDLVVVGAATPVFGFYFGKRLKGETSEVGGAQSSDVPATPQDTNDG